MPQGDKLNMHRCDPPYCCTVHIRCTLPVPRTFLAQTRCNPRRPTWSEPPVVVHLCLPNTIKTPCTCASMPEMCHFLPPELAMGTVYLAPPRFGLARQCERWGGGGGLLFASNKSLMFQCFLWAVAGEVCNRYCFVESFAATILSSIVGAKTTELPGVFMVATLLKGVQAAGLICTFLIDTVVKLPEFAGF